MDAWSGNGWFAPVLAEIGDKMPSFASTLFGSVFLVAIAVGAARWRWWLSLPALPFFAFWNHAEWVQLNEPYFGGLILKEMGVGYVVGQYVAINLPVVIGAVIVARFRRSQIRRARRAKNLCTKCGSPMDAVRCPECGAFGELVNDA